MNSFTKRIEFCDVHIMRGNLMDSFKICHLSFQLKDSLNKCKTQKTVLIMPFFLIPQNTKIIIQYCITNCLIIISSYKQK